MRANKMLLGWVEQRAVSLDRRPVPEGDHFGCRYELILSDVLTERRKTQWTVQLNMLTTG
jgi:hypothetical protein